jgi:hypothetical protein
MISARYAQLHGDELAGLVLSGPVLADQLVPFAETRTGIEALEFTRLEEAIYPGSSPRGLQRNQFINSVTG